ncbi:MAG TPA: ankyrin repeat domain-containing protein [Gammaproteobacteria bacterium]|jgi:hypothetical protein|nr:ankyrin repeat domain-containing protein [Gammaproteobacteria bacterium]
MHSLADAIIQNNLPTVQRCIQYGANVNEMDEYGFTPLIEAAIIDSVTMSDFLLNQGADVNAKDVTGGTALQWAVENNNIALCELLLRHGADPNAYNLSGRPVLALAILRQQVPLKNLLVKSGADLVFAQDFINVKLLGHLFELVGKAAIISPQHKFVEVDFEGFYLEVTLGLIAESLYQFQNHFAARQLKRYFGVSKLIVDAIFRAAQLIKYQQYRVNIQKHMDVIDSLLSQEPLVIPVGYEGHAITFIKYGDIWIKCDRREDSRLYDNVMFYRMTSPGKLTKDFLKYLLYEKHTSQFINIELDNILGLTPVTELKVEAQISGNCSWANVEATIPAIFFLVMLQASENEKGMAYYKTLALHFFHRWRDWNKERSFGYCIQSFKKGDSIRKACKADILGAILFQHNHVRSVADKERTMMILSLLSHTQYEYIIYDYLRIYYYESNTAEGKAFYELLKEKDLLKNKR